MDSPFVEALVLNSGERCSTVTNERSLQLGDNCVKNPNYSSSVNAAVQALPYEVTKTDMNFIDSKFMKEMDTTVGGHVKRNGHVLKRRSDDRKRSANLNCRVETFGRVCSFFYARRINWVKSMGFGGLLNLVDMHLPRNLCYWVLTRVDPIRKVMVAPDGHKYFLSNNQINSILGIPNGVKSLPKKIQTDEGMRTLSWIEKKFNIPTKFPVTSGGNSARRKGIPVTTNMLSRLEGYWTDVEEDEFKIMFLICALTMVLCPTQSSRLSRDLVPTLTCFLEVPNYNWCGLVLDKLMSSVRKFSTSFYAKGSVGGAGGCTSFLAILYLDRLARAPVHWGHYPRIGVWTMEEIRKAKREDKEVNGDFGALGMIDVAYDEPHPFEGRDKGIMSSEPVVKLTTKDCSHRKHRRGSVQRGKLLVTEGFLSPDKVSCGSYFYNLGSCTWNWNRDGCELNSIKQVLDVDLDLKLHN